MTRWTWLDSTTKIAVAIASGGGALAGLVFWKTADYTFLWPLSVAAKIKMHATTLTKMAALAMAVENLIKCWMLSDANTIQGADMDIDEFRRKYLPPKPPPPPPERPK